MTAAGVPIEFAEQQADVLIFAEQIGHPSHGLLRIPTLVARIRAGLIDPTTSGAHEWAGVATLRVDGGNGLGPVVANKSLDVISERASQTGVAIAALRRTSHLGMLAPYVQRIADVGQCAIAMCTSEALVHPWGGRTAMVGTNPLAIAVPAHPRPFVMDMSTGVVSAGKILDHARRQVPIPTGWALDEGGEPTTDAAKAAKGAIGPFGGPKGYALGLALEVLIASITETALGTDVKGTLDAEFPSSKGDLFFVIDRPAQTVVDAVSDYLQAVRTSPARDPETPVSVPGDRSALRRERSARDGLDVAAQTLDELYLLADRPFQGKPRR